MDSAVHARRQPPDAPAPISRSATRAPTRQLALRFDDTPIWEATSLERALALEAARPVRLTLTENRSVLLSYRRDAHGIALRLHRMFLYATEAVLVALGRHLRRRCRRADGELRRFMNENLHRVRTLPRTLPPLVPDGRVYDLARVFTSLNTRFFGGRLRVPITWGRGGGRARRGGLTFGSYDPVLRLIRIHPVLDRREVPLYFLESVVYHEMLHHHLGGTPDRAGRTVYHSRAFREAERRYPLHEQALAWEKTHLGYLLKASHALERERRSVPRA
jgi:hypothetical protein